MTFNAKLIDWDKLQGLIPAIIQHDMTGQVLMLGWMDKAALELTQTSKKVTFYSRSRQSLWTKGETSGHFLELKKIFLDCDNDTLLILANPLGPTCHKKTTACFANNDFFWLTLSKLEAVIQQRQKQQIENSYTVTLLKQGVAAIAQKVGEEAVETIIAALNETDERLCNELADLFYHILVLLQARKLGLANVLEVLNARF